MAECDLEYVGGVRLLWLYGISMQNIRN